MSPTIYCQDAQVFFDGHPCFGQAISFRLNGGKIYSAYGPNGAGKTTLTRFLSGVIPEVYNYSMQGSLRVGERVCDEPAEKARCVSVIPERSESLLLGLNVDEELALAVAKIPESASAMPVCDISDRLQLGPLKRQPISTLSTGEKKRLQIAVAIMSERPFVVCDDSFRGLDAHWKEQTMRLLVECAQAQERTILSITSDESESRNHVTTDLSIFRCHETQSRRVSAEQYVPVIRELASVPPACEAPSALAIPSLIERGTFRIRSEVRRLEVGSIYIVKGSNGSGKTTLLLAFAGLIPRRTWAGLISRRTMRPDCAIAMYDPTYQLFDSTLEGVFSQRQGFARDKLIRLVCQDFDCRSSTDPLSLSFGQRKFLVLLQMFASGRSIILLDDPLSGLDEHHRGIVSELLTMFSTLPSRLVVATSPEGWLDEQSKRADVRTLQLTKGNDSASSLEEF